MIASANRLRSMGWLVLLGLCLAMVLVLAFRVNALRSQIHRAEARIVALKQDKMYLETEFETRANQQQLKTWNDVEFGYAAPLAGQYLEGERQLAAFSVPRTPDAPAPIRVASVDDAIIASAAFPAMVSPLSGKPLDEDDQVAKTKIALIEPGDVSKADLPKADRAKAVETLNERLGKVVEARSKQSVRTATVSENREAKALKLSKALSDKSKPKPAAKSEKATAAKQTSKVAKSLDDKQKANKSAVTATPRVAKRKEAKAAL